MNNTAAYSLASVISGKAYICVYRHPQSVVSSGREAVLGYTTCFVGPMKKMKLGLLFCLLFYGGALCQNSSVNIIAQSLLTANTIGDVFHSSDYQNNVNNRENVTDIFEDYTTKYDHNVTNSDQFDIFINKTFNNSKIQKSNSETKNFTETKNILLNVGDNILEEELKNQHGADHLKVVSQREVMRYEKSKAGVDKLFLPPNLGVLENTISNMQDPVCKEHVLMAIQALNNKEKWAMQMLDSSVKFPDGVLAGSLYQLGNFDECIGIEYENEMGSPVIKGQYCLADVHSNENVVHDTKLRNVQRSIQNSTLHWAICLPHSCKPKEASFILDFILNSAIGYPNAMTVNISEKMCYHLHVEPLTQTDIVYGYVIVVISSIILLATVYHMIIFYAVKEKKRPGTMSDIILSFSLVRNVSKLLHNGKNDLNLNCICGIRFLSMLFIIAGHALVFVIGGPVTNEDFFKVAVHKAENSIFLNNPLLVDTFLLISGFLMCRLILVELVKRKGKVNFLILYIFRYIRLTPSYLIVIGLYCTWLIRFGEGPLWNSRISTEKERCLNSWWTNILYINNYVNTDKLCMFQSWYLAVDTQLFILAPLIVYPLWKNKKLGITILTACTITCIIIPFAVTFKNKLDPTLLMFIPEIQDISLNEYFVNVYIKTHIRATSYIFGIIFGYLVHIIQENDYKIPKGVLWFGWIFGTVCSVASMFSVIVFYDSDYTYDRLEASIYSALHRVSWCLGMGWIILACVTNNAGPIEKFLSWNLWVPLSRLTYCAYLVNGLIELHSAATIRQPIHMSIYNLSVYALSHTVLTFTLAFILCIMYESPIHGFEKILLRKEAQRRRPNDQSA